MASWTHNALTIRPFSNDSQVEGELRFWYIRARESVMMWRGHSSLSQSHRLLNANDASHDIWEYWTACFFLYIVVVDATFQIMSNTGKNPYESGNRPEEGGKRSDGYLQDVPPVYWGNVELTFRQRLPSLHPPASSIRIQIATSGVFARLEWMHPLGSLLLLDVLTLNRDGCPWKNCLARAGDQQHAHR
ncbi:hypothetical protein BKA70DRAFT_1244094 [Coprinopsis sp. MPI-PUGE-AT-0042]|nr:hypothetical protein BKA70DRAFT_1244094 [Coprinopsis sp. MPI-PUGE-AT-0042]